MLQPYRAVLSTPGALRFSAAAFMARAPMSMVGIGIVLMISSAYGSYGLAGQVSAAHVLVAAASSPILARLIDRHGQARAIRPVIAVGAAGLIALIVAGFVHAPAWVLYITAMVAAFVTGPIGAMVRSRWDNALPNPRDLHTAYALESSLDELLFIIGPALTTVLATEVAPAAGLVLPLFAATIGGYWFLSQGATEPPSAHSSLDSASSPGPDVRRTSVLHSAGMRAIALIFVATGALFGACDVATVAFTEEHGNKAATGIVLGVFALGSFIAGLLYGARHWVSPLSRRLVIGVVALAIGVSAFLFVTTIPMLGAVMFVVGFAIAPTLITGNQLVQRLVPKSQLTEGFAWAGTAIGLGVAAGSSLAGSAIDRIGSRGGYFVVMASAVCAAITALGALRALRDGRAPATSGPTRATRPAAAGG